MQVQVRLPTHLDHYSGGQRELGLELADGASLGDALDLLEQRYRGIRFRIIDEQDNIRRHIRVFVDGENAARLSVPLHAGSEVMVVAALSGG